MRAPGFMPNFLTGYKLKERVQERIQHFFEQRRLRMLARLGFRNPAAKKKAYDKAGGPAMEVGKISIYMNPCISW
jgi:hypothetical protein